MRRIHAHRPGRALSLAAALMATAGLFPAGPALTFEPELTRGKTTEGLSGDYTPSQALEHTLFGEDWKDCKPAWALFIWESATQTMPTPLNCPITSGWICIWVTSTVPTA